MAIKIKTYQTTDHLIGKSHWWGFPDLPEGVDFPCRGEKDEDGAEDTLTFICQLNLADVKPYDTDHLLPTEGMLYFFADLDYFLGDMDTECEGLGFWPTEAYRVIFAPTNTNLCTHQIRWEDGTSATLPAEAISLKEVSDKTDGHKLLGIPFYDEIVWEAEGMLSLLQIDEDERWGLRFYDMGNLNFLITPEALTTRDFTNVKLYFHSL